MANRRPRFVVREMVQLPITAGSTLQIRCSIGNAGDSDGTIIESFVETHAGKLGEWIPKSPETTANLMGSRTVVAGGHIIWTIDTKIGAATLMTLANAALMSGGVVGQAYLESHPTISTIRIHGIILYIDSLNVRRRTSFLRHLDIDTSRFIRSNNPDFEYAD